MDDKSRQQQSLPLENKISLGQTYFAQMPRAWGVHPEFVG